MKNKYILGLALAISCTASFAQSNYGESDCVETRVTFDIGSGSTKMNMAVVNACGNKRKLKYGGNSIRFHKIIHNVDLGEDCEKQKVEYRKDLAKADSEGYFSDAIQTEGLEAIQYFMKNCVDVAQDTLSKYRVVYSAVATSAFRMFKQNHPEQAEAFIARLKQVARIDNDDNFAIIPQQTEALMGFVGTVQARGIKDFANKVVWDIGGGSWQITGTDGKGRAQIFGGKLANDEFLQAVNELKPTDFSHARQNEADWQNNPNPLTADEVDDALEYVARYVQTHPAALDAQTWFAGNRAENLQVFGIGGVHKYPIAKDIAKALPDYNYKTQPYTQAMLQKVLNQFVSQGWDKDQSYAESTVTNKALILGYMQNWGIEQVQFTDANMTRALALNPNAQDWVALVE